MSISHLETQADFFTTLAYNELLEEMARGENPDIWEWEQYVVAGRLAILGAEYAAP